MARRLSSEFRILPDNEETKISVLVTVEQLLLDVSELTRPRWKNKSEAANVHIIWT